MTLSTNRGGAKPPMLTSPFAEDVPFMISGRRKVGVYERTRSILARRVELPAWLYKHVADEGLAAKPLTMPREEIGESRGQIYIDPPPELFAGPAVGLDMEVFDLLTAHPEIRCVQFHVYGNAYCLVDVLSIASRNFLRQAKLVQTKASFMPQMMVPLALLSSQRSTQH